MAAEGDCSQGSAFQDERPAEPASSILATHFAPRLATQRHEPQQLSREAFSQLRQELLGEKNTQFRMEEGITDINKLICIILKAGLEVSPTSSGPEEDLEGQVLDCLEIIQLSIGKAPQALWDISDPLILGEDVQAPLFSWLILRLIRLACMWHVETVQDRVHSILSSMACLQYKQVRSSPSCYGISTFLRACAMDTLSSLEGFLDMDLRSFRPVKLSMPSKSGSIMGDLDNLGLPRGLLKRSLTLGTFTQTAALATALLDALSPEASAQGVSKRRNCTLRPNLPWAMNGYHRLRKVLVRWLQTPGLKVTPADEQILSQFLVYTRRVCVSESSMATLLSDMSLASIWTQCLAEFLTLSTGLPMPAFQLDLSRFVDEVAVAIKQSRLTVPQLRDILLPVLTDIRAQDSNPQIVEQCLRTSISSLYTQLLDNTTLTMLSAGASSTSPDADSSVVNQKPRNVDHETEQGEDGKRAPKRLCLSAESSDADLVQMLLEELSTSLGCGCATSLTDLCAAVQNLYEGASDPQRTQFLQVLGKLSCAVVGTLERKSSDLITSDTLFCTRCDSDQREIDTIPEKEIAGYEDLWKILNFVLPRLSRTPGPRIAAMVALRRILMHSPNLTHMHLSSSASGEFCLHSLRSSIRELRVATGHSVVAFVRPTLQPDVRRANFVIVLEWLRNLSEKNDMPLQEACILTLCRLARVSEDDEKNIILLRLVEYLGHTNPYVCSVAYNELSKLAQEFSLTPAGLFRPYWRTLSVAVVKNLQTRPYMAEQLCELLGMKVDGFLRLTEVHVLPYLVLTRKRDIICRIGASRNEGESPFDVCSEKNNLAAILAFLLAQQSDNPEAMIMSLLAEIDPAFKGRSLAELVRIEPILTACDLLKSLGDAGEQNKERFLQALRRLATFVPRKFLHASSSKKADLLSHFIEEHVLGIITQFANAINDFQVRQTLAEKRRNLKAIEEMINIAQGHVSNALPQVCACLRSALEIDELCDHAFSAWRTLIRSLGEEDIEPLIDQTWAIVIRYWERLTDDSRKQAHQLIDHILTNQPNLVRDTFNTMPSLASIPELAAFETNINELRAEMDVRSKFLALIRRCQSENSTVVEQALRELMPFVSDNEEFLHVSVLSEQPDPVVAQLTRALLDCCVKFNTSSDSITLLSSQCLGLIGCLDPNRVETIKEKKDILVLSNFDRMEETVEFILFFLQHVLVEAFLSASNTRAQGFLAYAMQGLLKICNLNAAVTQRSRDLQGDEKYQRWMELPESVRNTLTPFLTSTYTVTVVATNSRAAYPLLSPKITHSEWLRALVQDLLQTGNGDNAKLIFAVCSRVVKGQDISISSFLFPFAALNRIVGGTEQEQQDLQLELLNVLSHPLPEANNNFRETIISSSQSVFEVLDYLSRWLQGKKKQLNALNVQSYQSSRSHRDVSRDALLDKYASQIKSVEALLASIPPEIISKRAVECKSFSRALFHWEQYIRKCKSQSEPPEMASSEQLYERLQDIYSQIDEPDGIEGISSHLSALSIDQQVLEHRKAGRWATAQSWYELELEKEPENVDAQWNLVTCLKESGQQDAILTRFEVLKQYESAAARLLPFAVEASWITGRWDKLQGYLELCASKETGEFNVRIGAALDALRQKGTSAFMEIVNELRLSVAKSLSANSVASLQSCHDDMLRLHALADMEAIVQAGPEDSNPSKDFLLRTLNRRLNVLGGYLADKQYLLGLRRAAMELAGGFGNSDISAAWLTSAHLSRKGNFTGQAYHSMLHAARLKDRSATIEHARLLWKDGHHRKAIQTLEGAIASNESNTTTSSVDSQTASFLSGRGKNQNETAAVAHLMLAKWTDRAGQTHSQAIVQRYRTAIRLYPKWEKAHYYLGKHYNKILDLEKVKPMGKEAQIYLSGEATKLVIDNYLRSLTYGCKYVFQTLPKILTLWLEHASVVDQPIDPKRGDNESFRQHTHTQRLKSLDEIHSQLKKYILTRLQAFLLFTILHQMVARICHRNNTVYDLLARMVTKAVQSYPQQGLWTVLAVVKSSNKDRALKGQACLAKIQDHSSKARKDSSEIRRMIQQGQRFSDELLQLCLARVEERATKVTLARNLGFNHKVAPCRLVVPFQAMLIPSLPVIQDSEHLKGFRPFPRDPTTIEAVLDEAQILNSLQKPRKISIRGSDGKIYNALCKPKDDLRKDQRLMEFNNMINRFLKRDVESSKRRMYIKTYAVTPLNEECGIIEWVDNLRTLRDIIVKLLRERRVQPNYTEIRHYLDEICADRTFSKLSIFNTKILAKLPCVLHEWFIEMFPETESWFTARMRYTRSAAVMSMVGYVLGLGDRHGENLLFEEGTGGILHVDFNCLFDKGQTFEKPEVVPFRLTHNMIDAFGAYGYNGPFRRTCEITLGLLRQNEDALMTILETFLHDPTTDFIGKRRRTHANVPDTPAGVLDDVRNKLRGFMSKQPIPLSVDGQVDELIMQATDKKNLASMYVGWCAFF
ncbi:Putative UVSB PI-3 kinase [Penicillium brasilianum]|uniref:Serine/threonine-protein kinase MEC1 n=1 Tax=Penicillium brasilianum TaxID=104259 RepID=A0A0F7TI77_PENBI|nr:Putative UVSB PI-3 kinase [Penicillium brasilianum]